MIHTTCTSTDPTSHQGDTCPIHEQGEPFDTLVSVLKTLEWAVPTPDADTDGACPSCFAGSPVRNHKFWVIPSVFNAEYHMKNCQLAAALTLARGVTNEALQ